MIRARVQVLANASVLGAGVLVFAFMTSFWGYIYLCVSMLYIALSFLLQSRGYFYEERFQKSRARSIALWMIAVCLAFIWYGNHMGHEVKGLLSVIYALLFFVNLFQYRVYQKGVRQ